jgi:hypothetical protein
MAMSTVLEIIFFANIALSGIRVMGENHLIYNNYRGVKFG